MFNFYSELLKTKDESQFTDARAALETAGLKYRSYQTSEESRHMMHRPMNPGAFGAKNPQLNVAAIQQMSIDSVPGVSAEIEYVIEVPKKEFGRAKALLG